MSRSQSRERLERGLLLILFGALVGVACAPGEQETLPVTLVVVDSLLAELGGHPTAHLERGQRWRMISSIGAGLPPSLYKPEDLPDPRSRGAGLLRVYCVQCHWLPAPKMHAADEWSILVRRMLMRARTLKARLGGPLTEGLVGEILMAGMQTTALPSREELDTLLSYLQSHALPTAEPGELTDGPYRDLFVEQCSVCHETPSPRAHTAAGWDGVVARMRGNVAAMGVPLLTDEQTDRILAYLKGRAAKGR